MLNDKPLDTKKVVDTKRDIITTFYLLNRIWSFATEWSFIQTNRTLPTILKAKQTHNILKHF